MCNSGAASQPGEGPGGDARPATILSPSLHSLPLDELCLVAALVYWPAVSLSAIVHINDVREFQDVRDLGHRRNALLSSTPTIQIAFSKMGHCRLLEHCVHCGHRRHVVFSNIPVSDVVLEDVLGLDLHVLNWPRQKFKVLASTLRPWMRLGL